MSAAPAVWGNDLRNIVRDRTINVLVLVPLLFLVLLRYGVPLAEGTVPAVAGHRPLPLALFSMIAGMFPAFMLTFLMLDERDQGLDAAFRVLPVAPGRLLTVRLAMVGVLGFAYPLLLVAASGLVPRPLPALVVLSALCALRAVAALLVAVAVAGNKIEGLAVFKGLFFLIVLALPAVLETAWWSGVLRVLPSYWIYAAFAAVGTPDFWGAAAVAAALHLAVAALFARRLLRRLA